MRQFYAPTEDIIKSARSWFASDHSAGVTELTFKNVAQMEANKYICLGREGDETSELKLITEVDSDNNTVTIDSATIFPHYKDSSVTQFDYNQRKLYYRATSDDSWIHVASESPKNIAVDVPLGTLFEHSSGEATYQYCCTYYNSTTATETSTDDAEVVGSTSSSTNLCSIQQIRVSAGWQDNFYISDSRIDEARQEAQGEVWASLRKRYSFPITKNSSFLRRIVIDMAVGLLYIDEYGADVQNVALDGYKKIEDARERLMKIAEGEYTLYDESEDEDQTLSTRDTVVFYPDETTDEDANPEDDDYRRFSMGMKF